jgi:hypothetical protein
MLNFEEVKANRRKWIDFLREDGRKKAVDALDVGNEERCCLGHACFVLGVEQHVSVSQENSNGIFYGKGWNCGAAPAELIELVGLRSSGGSFAPFTFAVEMNLQSLMITSLAELNDKTNYTPKEIGDFIESHYDYVFLNEEEYMEKYEVVSPWTLR